MMVSPLDSDAAKAPGRMISLKSPMRVSELKRAAYPLRRPGDDARTSPERNSSSSVIVGSLQAQVVSEYEGLGIPANHIHGGHDPKLNCAGFVVGRCVRVGQNLGRTPLS